jgi:hypothetical protein
MRRRRRGRPICSLPAQDQKRAQAYVRKVDPLGVFSDFHEEYVNETKVTITVFILMTSMRSLLSSGTEYQSHGRARLIAVDGGAMLAASSQADSILAISPSAILFVFSYICANSG